MDGETRQERRAARKDRRRQAMRVHGLRYVRTALEVSRKQAAVAGRAIVAPVAPSKAPR